jgi:hypothetical protein
MGLDEAGQEIERGGAAFALTSTNLASQKYAQIQILSNAVAGSRMLSKWQGLTENEC